MIKAGLAPNNYKLKDVWRKTDASKWINDTKRETDLLYDVIAGDCGKTGRKNGAMECLNIGAGKGMYDAVKLEKG